MKNILVVVDMQNDFIDGALGTKESQKIVGNVAKKICEYKKENIFATRDTHEEDYLSTREGRILPVKHCIRGTDGWKIRAEIVALLDEKNIIDKPTFASIELAEKIKKIAETEEIKIELCGLCTDICVVSNALLLKAFLPETEICVDSNCCAGVTVEKHKAALETMKSCQITVL